ncbi:hypothetical protein OZY43_02740 [Lactobacillus sp. ESL0785]|uniref:hypothetical protein n=1 Tax=Lactobacillus sp. ESL0785 TaxID=2983232 RepID=UPI0023F8ECFD|nr:hypothetical protein [Lactobacillus sp. ESL0785]WEV71334.1 hypothetical protein OZY43_02740 [Lactobacillus sp. ESL0785]
MRLTDLLQLTNDLNEQTKFYLTINGAMQPLARLKISSSCCLLYPGKKPITKAKIISLVSHLHGRSIPLRIKLDDTQLAIYGVQILPASNAVRLT